MPIERKIFVKVFIDGVEKTTLDFNWTPDNTVAPDEIYGH